MIVWKGQCTKSLSQMSKQINWKKVFQETSILSRIVCRSTISHTWQDPCMSNFQASAITITKGMWSHRPPITKCIQTTTRSCSLAQSTQSREPCQIKAECPCSTLLVQPLPTRSPWTIAITQHSSTTMSCKTSSQVAIMSATCKTQAINQTWIRRQIHSKNRRVGPARRQASLRWQRWTSCRCKR